MKTLQLKLNESLNKTYSKNNLPKVGDRVKTTDILDVTAKFIVNFSGMGKGWHDTSVMPFSGEVTKVSKKNEEIVIELDDQDEISKVSVWIEDADKLHKA